MVANVAKVSKDTAVTLLSQFTAFLSTCVTDTVPFTLFVLDASVH